MIGQTLSHVFCHALGFLAGIQKMSISGLPLTIRGSDNAPFLSVIPARLKRESRTSFLQAENSLTGKLPYA